MNKQRPPDTIDEFESFLRSNEHKYRRHFKDDEQYEFFMMLPMDDALRQSVLVQMSSDVVCARELDSCRGCSESTPTHRLVCIKCVNVNRPSIARPFYE